jgi:hypothetical protein
MSRLAIAVVFAGAGLALGLVLRSSSPPPPPAPVRPDATRLDPVTVVSSPTTAAQLAPMIRTIVREELERAQPAAAARAEPPEPVAAPLPTAEQVQAHEHAQTVIAAALRTGRWTREDQSQLRELMSQLNEAERQNVVHTLLPAINRQELKIEGPGPAF